MFLRFFKVRKGEGRIILLLGSFFFLMLAGTTMIGIASESLFLSQLGASKLPYGILLGQLLIIPVFYVYGRARGLLRARWTNPIVVIPLLLMLIGLYLFYKQNPLTSAGLLLILVPCLAGLLGSENGRLSASMLDPRSARRLSPLVSTIGGLGASFGAFLSDLVSRHWNVSYLILIACVFIGLVMVPAWFVNESIRPRTGAKAKKPPPIRRHRYALMLVLSAGTVAAISTVLRTQLGAAAEEVYGEAELGIFFSRLALAINLAAIFFTLFFSRAIVATLGAANSLLLYPSIILSISLFGAFTPSLIAITSAVFVDRLVRQNVHGTVSTLAIMPLNLEIRVRAALLIEGSARPLGVILSSLFMILTVENVLNFTWRLDWGQLFWVVVALCLVIVGALAFVRGRYVIELVAALHSRRLRLESGDTVVLPMDGELKKMLLGYLRSDLPERCSLALQLLANYVDDDVVDVIEQCWPDWEPWLRADAIKVLAADPSDNAKTFIQSLGDDESDEVQATALKVFADSMEEKSLRQKISDAPLFTRSEAIAELGNRYGDESIDDLITGLSDSQHESDRKTAALTISKLESDHFDHLIPTLIKEAPRELLQTMAKRPQPNFAAISTPWLGSDRTFVHARRVLRNIGDESIGALQEAVQKPGTSVAALQLLAELSTSKAREVLFQFINHDDRDLGFRALVALSHEKVELTLTEKNDVDGYLHRSLHDVARFGEHQRTYQGALKELAISELRYALESTFAALEILNPSTAYRQLFLALYSHDSRQRALAIVTCQLLCPVWRQL